MPKTYTCALRECGREFDVGFLQGLLKRPKLCPSCRKGFMIDPARRIHDGVGEMIFAPWSKIDNRVTAPRMFGMRPQRDEDRVRAAVRWGIYHNPDGFEVRPGELDDEPPHIKLRIYVDAMHGAFQTARQADFAAQRGLPGPRVIDGSVIGEEEEAVTDFP